MQGDKLYKTLKTAMKRLCTKWKTYYLVLWYDTLQNKIYMVCQKCEFLFF